MYSNPSTNVKHHRRILILSLAVIALLQVVSGETIATEQEGRTSFGHNLLPIWSPLTEFESNTLQTISVNPNPSANTLLAFYVMASAEDRHGHAFHNYQTRIKLWIEDLPPSIRNKQTLASAKSVFQRMYKSFLDNESRGGGYSADQSQLTSVFDNGSFNCLSSSLLFIVIAKELGYDVSGIVLPSHAFVEIQLARSERIDIETTAYSGFNVQHDEAFYQREDNTWFEERNLVPPNYQDYLNRERVSTTQLGLINMWSQHAAKNRMPDMDRMRLAEIRGTLMPNHKGAQAMRLYYFNRELALLLDQTDRDALERLRDIANSVTTSLSYHWSTDEDFFESYASVKTQLALASFRLDDPEQGLLETRQLLDRVYSSNLAVDGSIEHNLFYALDQYINLSLEAEDYFRARTAFSGIEAQCQEHSLCQTSMLKLYSHWAASHWANNDWNQVISIYQEYLLENPAQLSAQTIKNNAQIAYVNWAREFPKR